MYIFFWSWINFRIRFQHIKNEIVNLETDKTGLLKIEVGNINIFPTSVTPESRYKIEIIVTNAQIFINKYCFSLGLIPNRKLEQKNTSNKTNICINVNNPKWM